MAYVLRYKLEVAWLGDGMGPMTGQGQYDAPNAQRILLTQVTPVLVPGGDAPNQANFNSAITGGMTTDLEAQIATNLGQIQAWASGGN